MNSNTKQNLVIKSHFQKQFLKWFV